MHKPRPKLGQHFLHDQGVVKTILHAAGIRAEDRILEIGPGRGILTFELVSRVREFTAIELDHTLALNLQTRLQHKPSCRIVQGDILQVDLGTLFPNAAREPVKILGNLPYSITSPIFEKLLAWPFWQTGVFLIQREVGERMRSEPGSRVYGILSLAVQLFAGVEIMAQVRPGAFSPAPQVHSVVVRLTRKAQPDLPAADQPHFFDLIHGAFAHRRKTLANSLSFFTGGRRDEIAVWLQAQGIDPGQRAERVPLQDYVRLAPAWAIYRRKTDLT